MRDLSAINGTLLHIRMEITKSPVFSTGRPADEEKASQEAERLNSIIETLRVIMRELQSEEHLIHLLETGSRKIPIEQRRSAQQSLEARNRTVSDLYRQANSLRKLVGELLRKNGLMNPFQVGKALSDLAKNLKGDNHQLAAYVLSNRTILTTPVTPIGAPGEVIPVLALALMAVKWVQRKWNEKSDAKH